jgi:phosphoglycerol transferase MdoB-like AlkP superfamily enzyme
MNYVVVSKKHKLRYILAFMFVHIFALLILLPNKGAVYSPYKLYHNMDVSNNTNSHFGLLTGMRLDLKRFIFKSDNYVIEVVNMNTETKPTEYGYNVTDIDFEALKKQTKNKNLIQMHNYFEEETPTQKNEYTGLFKDKNLIFIVAEGFSDIAVDEKLTPTLYKLSNESFVFKNFYTPVMFSTIGGEIQSLLGLIPFQETINLWPQEKPTFPYAIGNSFKNAGYTAKAYHNWTYTYYDRDKTRPTLRI